MIIRSEEPKDYAAVHQVNALAFETPTEANLVDVLRNKAFPVVSLVAEDGGVILGHIMFSPVSLTDHVTSKSWDWVLGSGASTATERHWIHINQDWAGEVQRPWVRCSGRTGTHRLLPPFRVHPRSALWD
jgi:hypothetical protein